MTFRVEGDASIPAIGPVPEGVNRPFWSVMIPTYNCDDLLEQTLRCVLDQDQGADRMQIAVVDDRSPNGRSRAIIEKLAPGRVEFFEQPSNVGLAGNWNTCIERSRGHWVHILHQDDLILPGFYERMGRPSVERPEIGAAFCRHEFIDADGDTSRLSDLEQERAGPFEGWAEKIAHHQRIQCPSIVVRRAAYEQIGGFRRDLVYCLDWEMWVRIAFRYPFWYEPEVLACWREHAGSETQRLARLGAQTPDFIKGVSLMIANAPSDRRPLLYETVRFMRRDWEVEAWKMLDSGQPCKAMSILYQAYRYEGVTVAAMVLLKHFRWATSAWFRRQSLGRPARARCDSAMSGASKAASQSSPGSITMPDPDPSSFIRPTVSVLMPVYNAERYVAEAIESILAQTFADFEFLIVDDGSTDGSRAILEGYAERDRRIRLVSRPNTGYAVALNEMLGRARGEFVARMDADDAALPERIALQVTYLREHPEVLCLGGSQYNVDASGWLLEATATKAVEHEQIDASIFGGLNPISHPTVMYRREAVQSLGGYRAEMMPAEDVDLWLRLGERGRLAILKDFVLRYRYHEGSVSERHQLRQLDRFRAACNEAYDRRGLERRPVDNKPWRPVDRRSRFDYAIRCGWTGYMRGERDMARHYGIKAVRLMPHHPAGWRLLVCALIKPMKAKGSTAPASPTTGPKDPQVSLE